jgi:thiamine-phosphate pyrophosphorylase
MRPEPPDGAVEALRHKPQPIRPALCLVTDRHRLVAALALPASNWRRALVQQVAGAIAGGVDVIQLRECDLDGGVLAAVARDCLRAAAGTRSRVVINDRVDVALACGAHGVHLREDGLAPAAARRLGGPAFLIGRSVHSPEAACASDEADYLVAGPVFETVSKTGHPGLGVEGFRAIVRSARCPVWAIGGITADREALLIAAGAAGVAAIGSLIPAGPVNDIASSVEALTKDLRIVFDSPSGLS